MDVKYYSIEVSHNGERGSYQQTGCARLGKILIINLRPDHFKTEIGCQAY